MAITTVGMALEFAGKLEDQLEAVCHQSLDSAGDDQTPKPMLSLIKAIHKRKAGLKRLYDDNVYSDMDTGVLAPITSMREEDYTPATSLPPTTNDENQRQSVTAAEKTIQRFYKDLADRLRSGPRPILKRIEKMAKEIGEIHRIS